MFSVEEITPFAREVLLIAGRRKEPGLRREQAHGGIGQAKPLNFHKFMML
jgi:hypothetical protein